jgi:glycosyltransferase involved in cell wall biosynthesis
VRVSWLIPVRDRRHWLAEAVNSALRDSGPDDEILVIDDGSQDRPEQVLPTDRKVHILRQPPQGIVAALEKGRREARGEFLARLDSDDRSLPGRLDAQVRRLQRDPALVAVGGRACFHPDQSLPGRGMRHYLSWINRLPEPMQEILVECPLIHPAVMARAEAVEEAGGYRLTDMPEDYELWLRLAERGGRLANLERDVVWIRDHGGRLTRTDPRYSLAAFRRARMQWARNCLLKPGQRVVVWGGGRTGRPWIRWLIEQKVDLCAVLDLKPGGTRQGVPVLPTEDVSVLDFDLLLVAVGARGARGLIRGILAERRPELLEGRDWWAVA